jgi:signal transduction histidine kinase/ligand-binding sensor domain-containing protein/CheY-like chemotaxis protein
VYDITQDSDGFIWIATREGLNKYDGQDIRSYYNSGIFSIPGNFITQLLVTASGDFFVGTQRGVALYLKKTDRFSTLLFQGGTMGNVLKMLQLSSGDILVSTSTGLFLINRDFQTRKISDLFILDLCEYKSGIIWGLYEDEILVMNSEGDIIRRHTSSMESTRNFDMSSSNIECLYKDSRGVIWLGTKRDGIGYYNQETDKFYSLKLEKGVNPIEDNFIRVINEDLYGRLWIGTESGLYIYDVNNQTFTFYGQSFNPSEEGLNDKAIYSIFRSRDKLMWIGTYFGGVNFTSLLQKGFNRIYADGGRLGLSGNAVSEIIETSDKKLWIGTEDGGISIFDPVKRTFDYLKHLPSDPRSLTSNNVHALEEDNQGNIWIGTFIGGLNKYNVKNKIIESVEHLPPAESLKKDVYSKSLFSVFIDSKQRTWLGSIGGLYMREKEADNFKLWYPALFQENFVYHIEEDYFNNIWVCTYDQGIFKIDKEMQVSHFQLGTNHDILSNQIVFCLIDSVDFIWFGTVEGGLLKYNCKTNVFKSYTGLNGLSNNTVYAIAKDRLGRLWLSTNKGISMFDRENETFVNYTENDGLVGNQFNFKSGLAVSSGLMYFGAVNGITYFDPLRLRQENYKPEIHFTNFLISNQPVAFGEENILTSQIDYQDEISLRYKHKVFTIDFVALDFMAPKNIEYGYYLEGLEDNWNYVGNKHSATYTNLSPGKYIFHLKAANADHVWNENGRTLTINIRPPFYLSFWGFALFGIILLSSSLLFIRLYLLRQKEKVNAKIATLEKLKNEEISRHRLNFFTYISHEFKTPLSLILATLEQIMTYEDILPRFKDYGILMRKNAMRLLFLINQLMDFRKIETDHTALKYNKGEIIGFIKSTFLSFNPLMQKLSVNAWFTSNVESYIVYFDADKLEKILTNLISNSCKSFKNPGTVSVNVTISERTQLANPSIGNHKEGELVVTIADDGPGLPPEKLKRVFEPFEFNENSDIHSSGIGLSLVKSLIKYMNGQIWITSSPKGGTKAVIQLPLIHNPSPDLIKNEVFIENNTSFCLENTSLYIDSEPLINMDFMEKRSVKEYELLIVEDNTELASFLSHHFAGVFKIHTAYNGIEALKKVKKNQPDLVISDIMMPHMDGYALCNSIKDSIETCHIPVILLTSKTDSDSRIEGFFRGADAYIGKPFNLKELDLQIRNILRSRENIRKHFASFENFKESVGKLGNKDQMFIKSLTATVFKFIDDGAFDVDKFCSEANVSRTLLHMKLKKITGLSTTEFIKKIRLNEARKMLEEGTFTVSEIAYKVGFNDPAYFSKSFKRLFGKTPTGLID